MFKIIFDIHGNPDRGQDDWTETHTITADTVSELRKKVVDFQGNNDIGGGNWGKAVLFHEDKIVGWVSYNLRVWDKPYWTSESKEVAV
jgi:hypothetical protein